MNRRILILALATTGLCFVGTESAQAWNWGSWFRESARDLIPQAEVTCVEGCKGFHQYGNNRAFYVKSGGKPKKVVLEYTWYRSQRAQSAVQDSQIGVEQEVQGASRVLRGTYDWMFYRRHSWYNYTWRWSRGWQRGDDEWAYHANPWWTYFSEDRRWFYPWPARAIGKGPTLVTPTQNDDGKKGYTERVTYMVYPKAIPSENPVYECPEGDTDPNGSFDSGAAWGEMFRSNNTAGNYKRFVQWGSVVMQAYHPDLRQRVNLAELRVCTQPGLAEACDGVDCGDGKCVPTSDTEYLCRCEKGYQNEDTEDVSTACVDIDECASTPNICTVMTELMLPDGLMASEATCVNDPGAAHCECPDDTVQYEGQCVMLRDECSMDIAECGNAECVDEEIGYDCVCPGGTIDNPAFVLGGTEDRCIPIDGCKAGGDKFCHRLGRACVAEADSNTDFYCGCPKGTRQDRNVMCSADSGRITSCDGRQSACYEAFNECEQPGVAKHCGWVTRGQGQCIDRRGYGICVANRRARAYYRNPRSSGCRWDVVRSRQVWGRTIRYFGWICE